MDFLESTFNLNSITIVDEINYDKRKPKEYKFFRCKKSFVFRVFLIYLILFLILFSFLFFYKTEKKEVIDLSDLKQDFKKQKAEKSFEFLTSKFVDIYYFAKQRNIEISTLILQEKTLDLKLYSNQKQNIYDFLKNYETKISSFKYDEIRKEYEAYATIRFP